MPSYSREQRNPKEKKSKKECSIYHAKRRSHQRIGVTLTPELHKTILKAVHGETVAGIKVSFKASQSQTRKVYIVEFADREDKYDMIYDSNRNVIITFFTHDESDNIYNYFDVFGNNVNLRAEYGFFIKRNENQLYCSYLDMVSLGDDRWYVVDWDKTFVYKNGSLHELLV